MYRMGRVVIAALVILAMGGVILSPAASLALLQALLAVLLPVLLIILGWLVYQHRLRNRSYGKFTRPKHYDRNLIVIGAGAAGLVSAYIAATVKARVTLVEAHKMGGDCLNYGCVPSKALIQSAKLAHRMRHADRYGLQATEPVFAFRQLMARVQQVIDRIAPHDSIERYQSLGVEVLQGHARLIDPWTVAITAADGSEQRLTTRAVIIATGARPFVPPLPGIEEVGYLTSDNLWQTLSEMEQPPARLVVLGGGPIGCELAQAMARLGSYVIQVQRGPRLLPNEDEAVSALAHKALGESGVEVLVDHEALRCEREGEQRFIVVQQGSEERRIEFDALLCAVGRVPRLEGYGLEALGIETRRTVVTNDYLETLYPHILAAGDVVGPYQFTHTASHQAWYATVNALFGQWWRFKVDYSVIPWCTFIDPEVARVGLNEQEAKAKGIPYELTRYDLEELDRAIVDGSNKGFIQVLTVPGKDRILGVTIVAEQAAELLPEFVLAMRHGLGLNKILATIQIYPTLAEANKYPAGEWRKSHAPDKIMAWLGRYHRWRRGGE
jgi:pyruvate/2-oxoglutarate dehydrogenase complex dihydrolipoamide dehydrogenase (E3) component